MPRWPQLQYNYDKPVNPAIENNVIPQSYQEPQHYQEPQQYQEVQQYQEPQVQQYPEPPRNAYRPHYESYEPEQPADVPVVIGKYVPEYEVTTTTTTQAPYFYPEYEEIEIITAPPVGGHRHYGQTYEVQVGTNFNTRQK